jgi:CxxC motif-containing protein (DUF1111 family)
MHDLQSLSLEDAIERHKGEASDAEKRFDGLTPRDQTALVTFLNSL